MSAIDKIFIFGNTELHKLSRRPTHEHSMLNVPGIVQENNPNYFVVWDAVFGYSSDGCNLFKNPYYVQMYAKNRVKKLYEEFLEMDIELTMPDELRDYCL